MIMATVLFLCWEGALFAMAVQLARLIRPRTSAEFWLIALSIEVTLESSIAGAFSFAHLNSRPAYWMAAALCAGVAAALHTRLAKSPTGPATADLRFAAIAALVAPLILLSFKPVEEIDSINYLHYMIEWLSNRATPYTFATNYVAFWELSFAPTWMVTGLDVFFPLLAGKGLVLMALAVWMVGEELNVPGTLLPWLALDSIAMQHFWFGYSGVPTLKNDVMHGVGFVLLTLVVVRAAKRDLSRGDVALLAFATAFASVKYTGIFAAIIAVAILLFLRRSRGLPVVAAIFVLTGGHYYLHNFFTYGSPFYPFQLNLAFIHLPGTADLSNTSILYSLHDPRLWRALFVPVGGMSPAGLLFPVILAATLIAGAVRCVRGVLHFQPLDYVAFFLLCGWLLYFRSVFSASAYVGDLAFILNSLNSIRYVDGVLAISEGFLVVLLVRYTWLAATMLGVNLASRLLLLYVKVEWLPALAAAAIAFLVFYTLRNKAIPVAILGLIAVTPLIVDRNRGVWTTYWNDLKPEIARYSGKGLAELALPDGGYFAGHIVAAGNPADLSVRSLLPEEVKAARPPYLVVLVSPGSEVAQSWETRYGPAIAGWGYQKLAPGKFGALYELPTNGPVR